MPIELPWHDVALRLALTVVAGVLLGLNRSERGVAAGLRTTLLVCLAASVAMIQTNLLLATAGKPLDSFVSLDLMRLPLGVLTGMGFIGGGAILRRGSLIQGVTTAATLWLATLLGLCFGGGQLVLGLVALALGLIALWALKPLERRLPQARHATLTLSASPDGPSDEEVRTSLAGAGYEVASWEVAYTTRGQSRRRTVRCEVRWLGRAADVQTPSFVGQLSQRPGVLTLRWQT